MILIYPYVLSTTMDRGVSEPCTVQCAAHFAFRILQGGSGRSAVKPHWEWATVYLNSPPNAASASAGRSSGLKIRCGYGDSRLKNKQAQWQWGQVGS